MRAAILSLAMLGLLAQARAADGPEGAGPPKSLDRATARLSVARIESRVAGLKSLPDLSEADRTRARELYAEALTHLKSAEEARRQAAGFRSLATEAPRTLTSIRAELAVAPEPTTPPEAAPDARLAELEAAQGRAEGELEAARADWKSIQAEPRRRGRRRTELSKEQARLTQRLAELERRLVAPESTGRRGQEPERARRVRGLALRRALQAELEALRAESDSYDARAELLPARIDLARRRLARAESQVEAWQKILAERRRQETENALKEADRLRRKAARREPEIRAMARENSRLAERRSGDGGTTARLEALNREVIAAGEVLERLRERFRSVHRKVEAAGLTNAMGLLLRREYDSLPDISALAHESRRRQEQISDTQYQLILLEESRSESGDVAVIAKRLVDQIGSNRTREERRSMRRVVRELLIARRGLLDALINELSRSLDRLVELDRLTAVRIRAVEEYRGYIEERILWVRSVAGGGVPSLASSREALIWLADPAAWESGLTAVVQRARQEWTSAIFWLIVVLVSLIASAGARRRLEAQDAVVERSESDSFRRTLEALVWTALPAIPGPLITFLLARALAWPADQPESLRAVVAGLQAAAPSFLAMELLRHTLRPSGLGETHFRWSAGACAAVRQELRWFLPAHLAALLFVHALDSTGVNTLMNDSLGRVAFVVDRALVAIFLFRLLRPSGALLGAETREPEADSPVEVSGGRPLWALLLLAVPPALAVLTLRGFHFTALQLEARVASSLWLLAILVLTHALFLRWLRVAQRQLVRDAEAAEAAKAPDASSPAPIDGAAAVQAESQAAPEAVSPAPIMTSPEAAAETPARTTEAGTPDEIARDVGAPDAATPDTTPDEIARDVGTPDAATPDTTPDAGIPKAPTDPRAFSIVGDDPQRDEPGLSVPESGDAAAGGMVAVDAGLEDDEEAEPAPRERLDLPAISEQSRKFIRSLLTVAAVLGLAGIWGPVLPALRRLDEIIVWPTPGKVAERVRPRLEALEGPAESPGEALGNPPAQPAQEKPSTAPPGNGKAAPAMPPGGRPLMPGGATSSMTTGATDSAESAGAALPRVVTLADLGLAILLLGLTVIAGSNIPGLIEIILLQRLPIDSGGRYAISTIGRYVIVIAGVSSVFATLGIEWSSIQWLAAALTFGLAFGLQEIFANFVSGLILLSERPIRVGDLVTVGGTSGRVQRIRIRTTTIRNFDRKELIIPNKTIVTEKVLNWGLTDTILRVKIEVGLAYGSEPAKVKGILLAIAKANKDILAEPKPSALFLGYEPHAMRFQLRVYVPRTGMSLKTKDYIFSEIHRRFAEESLVIPYPQMDLHMHSETALPEGEDGAGGEPPATAPASP